MNYTQSLETERLVSRRLVFDDYKIWTKFFEDPEAYRYLPKLDTEPEARAIAWMKKQMARYESQRFGLHALIEKSTGDFIGQCGLLLHEVSGRTETEIGYHILPRYWRKGFAFEAASRFKQYGFDEKLCKSMISIVHVDNMPSQKVALKNGMHREKETVFYELPVYIYRT